jgi:peptidoglycan/xylan/chitin deacetylase (PgdA/CDA1 family)
MKYAAMNINLDSFGEAYGFPADYLDPTFGPIMDRFLMVAEKWGFKYSIYVIGKDLLSDRNRSAVSEWSSRGHEIGNHTWSHPLNLGALSKGDIYEEVARSHEAITNCTGREPKGFIAPGWSTSPRLIDALLDLGYEYDTSTWPSLLMYPALAKMLLNHWGDKRFLKILHRSDLHYPLMARREGHVLRSGERSLVSLPLPTNKWRMSCWHTTAFMLGWDRHAKLLRSCMREIDSFYYLLHPADMAGPEDMDVARKMHVERMQFSLQDKLELYDRAIQEIVKSGRKLVTMQELARQVASGT